MPIQSYRVKTLGGRCNRPWYKKGLIPGGGQNTLFFFHHPKTAQGINLKLSDFKDTPL